MRFITIGKNDSDQRLDRFLEKYLPNASNSFLQKMIRKKKIKKNGKRAEASDILKEGDELAFYIYEEILQPLEGKIEIPKSSLDIQVIYEDEHLLIMDKAAGTLSHPVVEADRGHTLVDGFIHYLIEEGSYQPEKEQTFVPALLNRLDFNTAGLVMGAKSHQAMLVIQQALKEGQIKRLYRALVQAEVKQSCIIDKPLRKRGKKAVVEAGASRAISKIRPIKSEAGISDLEVELVTGRFHQIRAHLASEDMPIIGDPLYNPHYTGQNSRQLLLAYGLEFSQDLALPSLKGRTVQSNMLEEYEQAYGLLVVERGPRCPKKYYW